MTATSAVPVLDAIRAIAFVGDLAMGQPTDHSLRTAWIAHRLAQTTDGDERLCSEASIVALLRWSGCTANAHEFALRFGDDVGHRQSLLAIDGSDSGLKSGTRNNATAFFVLSRIHCEVAADIGALLGLSSAVQFALGHLFESFDGSGAPGGLAQDAVPPTVYLASIASDLEILHRLYGFERTRDVLRSRAQRQYPGHLAECAIANLQTWLLELETMQTAGQIDGLGSGMQGQSAPLEILADVIDLKLPWMTGHSRLSATLARSAAEQLGLDRGAQERVYRAGLVHGIGRAAVPNMLWDMPSAFPESAWERVRLVPYWTSRAGRLLRSLEKEVGLASLAYERLDGSGYFRGLTGADIPLEGRILAAAVAKAALSRPRPWRSAYPANQVRELLFEEARKGRMDGSVVRALFPQAMPTSWAPGPTAAVASGRTLLTEREREILRYISFGESNKSVAQRLSISPSTVRSHVENVFRKLGCTTRAAATLKAVQLGILDPLELR